MTKKLNINQSCEIYDRTPGSPPLKISACSSSYPPDKNYLHNTSTHPGCLYSQGLEDHPPQLIDALCQPSNPLIINAMRSMEKRYCDHELLPGNPLI